MVTRFVFLSRSLFQIYVCRQNIISDYVGWSFVSLVTLKCPHVFSVSALLEDTVLTCTGKRPGHEIFVRVTHLTQFPEESAFEFSR
jgi:hypothetical protein